MKLNKVALGGFITTFSTPVFAHSGAGAPHIHWTQAFDATPAHIAGLAIVGVLLVAGVVGLCRRSRSSVSTGAPDRRDGRPS